MPATLPAVPIGASFAIRTMPDGRIVDRHCTRREAEIWLHGYNELNKSDGRYVEAIPEPLELRSLSGGKGGVN